MSRLTRSLLCSLFVLLAGRGAKAQPAPAPPWDEPRAVARALSRSPEARRAGAILTEARSRRAYANVPAVGNPTVAVRAMVGLPDVPAATWALVIGLPFDVSGVRGRWRTEADRALRGAEAQAEVSANNVRARARSALVEVALADALVRTASEHLEMARQLLEHTRTRASSGTATALDVALSEHEAADAEASVAAAGRAREEATGRFRAALDLNASEEVRVAEVGLPSFPQGLTREAAIASAAARRREAAALGAEGDRLRASADRLRAGAVAPLLVAGEVEWQGYEQASVGASLQWALPLTQTAQGDRAVALAQATVADVERDVAGRSAAREAATAWGSLRLALDELTIIDARSLPARVQGLALTETLFQSGAVDLFRVLHARQELVATRVHRLEVLRAAWLARIELDRATGER